MPESSTVGESDENKPDVTASGAADTGTTTDANADVADLSYEQARDELMTIVARLESGEVDLEESMSLWQRGDALAAHCSTALDSAEAALDQDQAGA